MNFVYSYERKRNDVNGNPRHFVHNLSKIVDNKLVLLVDKIDVGFRTVDQAIIETLADLGVRGFNAFRSSNYDMAGYVKLRNHHNFCQV